ncbi:hypothetical protein [uncultured Aquimarina sp.]|uniref:hypothetical protein n=1 Tax=uncultured Aquimarina sp. TaxID=575652 RepID=UPI0026324126|nr:hypothetical protein [uncultured Aquimarina sp.]
MKKLLYIFIFLVVASCDDGDIIVTSFEFEDVDLQLCEGANTNEFVFFKINTSVNEAISYNFIDARYSSTTPTESDIIIDLEDSDNSLIYRQFNNSITADYYCSNIPDANITVTDELLSVSGQATIINQIVSEDDNDGLESTEESPNAIDPEADPDGDGVPNYLDDDMANPAIGNTDAVGDDPGIEDGYNHDDDFIPSFKDQDDDNDNVLTSVELPNDDPNDDSFLDTDEDGTPNYIDPDDDGDNIATLDEDVDGNGSPRDDDSDNDGIPNYLDDDDDGDGILTKEEDTNNNNNPLDDDEDGDGIPNYLDTDEADDAANINMENPSILDNTVITVFRTTLTIDNLVLNEENDQFDSNQFSFGFRDETISITTEKNED